jgi:hypothetical protein
MVRERFSRSAALVQSWSSSCSRWSASSNWSVNWRGSLPPRRKSASKIDQLGRRKLSRAARLLTPRQPLDERQHQHQRLFGHASRVHSGVVGDGDASRRNCGDVDRVIPDTDQLDEANPRRHRQHGRVDTAPRVDQDLRVHGQPRELIILEARRDGDLNRGGEELAEPVHRHGKGWVDQQDLGHGPVCISRGMTLTT